jgi:hypothetical protein
LRDTVSVVLDRLRAALRLGKRPVVAPPEVLRGTAHQLFGFRVQGTPDDLAIVAWGPDGRQVGRRLRGLTDNEHVVIAAAGFQAVKKLDDALALAGAWDEACRKEQSNAAVIERFAVEMTRITGVDPRP